MDVMEIVSQAEVDMSEAVAKLPRVPATEVGLDARSGKVWVDVDNGYIITNKLYVGSLRHFGGFQYVDKDSVQEFGGFTIFMDGDDRVYEAIEHYEDTH